MYRLMGWDRFDGDFYPLIDYVEDSIREQTAATYDEALTLARARFAYLEQIQPSASSGGQGLYGIQDEVWIIHPNGRGERILPHRFE